MAKNTLLIDGDRDHFFLSVDGDTLRVGENPAHSGGVVRGVKVVRIRCEVEIESDRQGVSVEGGDGASPPRELAPGGTAEVGHCRLSLTAAPGGATAPPAAAPVPSAGVSRRLVVFDGADQGRTFKLPAAGVVTVGKAGKGIDIGLGDLYVARTHCQLAVGADGITVTHLQGVNGTLIDGRKIEKPQLLPPGSVLRVGNSHLRLEVGTFADEPPAPPPAAKTGEDSAVHRLPAAAKPVAARPGDALSQLEGRTLGHHEIGPLLGRGYTGAVYRATDVKTGQTVALKILAPEFPASAAELERFSRALREGQTVRHPNLAAPLGAGKTGAHCWIAREFVDGESAADVIERMTDGEKPSWTRAARVAVQLARAIDCLHQHRLVHGNITPRNVLIRKSDSAARLTDLRLGQALEGSRLLASVREKKLLAELPYMAPEQAEPGAFVDDLADLYAVGAVAYALATGRPPISGGSSAELLDAVQHGRVARPSAIYRKIPAAFEAVLMKLLAHAQEDRYPNPAALLEDLEPLAQAHGIEK